jgi:large subunit ribosomal protein L29
MTVTELRAMDAEAIRAKLREWDEREFRQRCEKKVGTLENTNVIRETRRDIARALTILREKEHAGSQP